MKTTPKPLGDPRLAQNGAAPVSRAVVLVFTLSIAALALLGCTRDRPVEGNVATPGAAVAEMIQLSTIPTSTPQPALSGEPSVVVSDTASADGTPAPTVEGGAETIEEYIVESGDTLLSIAIDFGMALDDLRALNFLDNDLISVGQPLRVRVLPPTPTPTPEPFFYTVQAGDSLGGIATRFGIGMVDLMNANRLEDPNAIAVGRELIIPGAAPVASGESGSTEGASAPIDPSAALVHVVRSGESLSQIAQDYGVTAAAIVTANGISNPNSVRVGTELTIPGISAAEWADRNAVRHTVGAGESLSQIAQQYGVTTAAIVAENGLANPNAIRVGQVLRIPANQ